MADVLASSAPSSAIDVSTMEASTTSLTEHIASTTSLTSEPPSRAPILAKEIPVDISDGADAVPTIELHVGKAEGSSGRWGGFIESIGEDSIL